MVDVVFWFGGRESGGGRERGKGWGGGRSVAIEPRLFSIIRVFMQRWGWFYPKSFVFPQLNTKWWFEFYSVMGWFGRQENYWLLTRLMGIDGSWKDKSRIRITTIRIPYKFMYNTQVLTGRREGRYLTVRMLHSPSREEVEDEAERGESNSATLNRNDTCE